VPQTLLLADDSVTIQRVIELTFADEDIDVIAVSDGDQAIARLDSIPPDIVLADVGMPGKTGYDVAAYVKQTPRLSHIPVVLLTGAFEPVDEQKAAGSGCDGVLAKPFEPQQVIGRVKELLRKPAPPSGSLEGALGTLPLVAGAVEEAPKSIDDYFDQLDAAFSTLAGKPAESSDAPSPVEIDWFGLKPAGSASAAELEASSPREVVTHPLWSTAVPEPEVAVAQEPPRVLATEPRPAVAPEPPPVAAPEPRPVAAPEPSPAPAAVVPSLEPRGATALQAVTPRPAPPPALPPLADAFAALLEAEQGELRGATSWPAAAAPVAITDDLIDAISMRVLEQLTDRVVRDTVASVAERLVREEIERIKASIE
jgi:CheY-like chemotaxis protein